MFCFNSTGSLHTRDRVNAMCECGCQEQRIGQWHTSLLPMCLVKFSIRLHLENTKFTNKIGKNFTMATTEHSIKSWALPRMRTWGTAHFAHAWSGLLRFHPLLAFPPTLFQQCGFPLFPKRASWPLSEGSCPHSSISYWRGFLSWSFSLHCTINLPAVPLLAVFLNFASSLHPGHLS